VPGPQQKAEASIKTSLVDDLRRVARTVRSLTPPGVRRLVGRVGSYLTADLSGSMSFPSIELALDTLRQLGFNPGFTVDVGAYRGEWTRMVKKIFPGTRVLMLEAQESKTAELEELARRSDGSVFAQNALLGSREGVSVSFHEMATGSSVFAETSPYPRVTVEKKTRTLDGILEERGLSAPDLLKLDVQGYELEVLKGAARALEGVQALLLEVSLVPVNSGCPLAAEVIQFLSARGFQLFDFCSQVRRADGVLWQTDLLFLRAGSPFLPRPELTRETWG
jgi:FkbM family methyltransferase